MSILHFPGRSIIPRRIFCIGKNYRDHNQEMGEPESEECVIFMKPVTSLVSEGESLHIPRDKGIVHHEVEVVICIGDSGSSVNSMTACSIIQGISLGLDLTLRSVQTQLKKKGFPWELSKAFDQSAPVGRFIDYDEQLDIHALSFTCSVNGEVRQYGNTKDMIFPPEQLISLISNTWKLLPGDLIFTGTPSGVGPLREGDTITVSSPQIGSFTWKVN